MAKATVTSLAIDPQAITSAVAPLPGFADRLLDWHRRNGRHDLPWQQPRTPYRVWLSEIMLQQTQVATVIAYFQRFIAALPDLQALAAASEDQVLALWSGLGYYSRARHLHAAARLCQQRHGGHLPADADALLALPGIGRSTAGAILAQAHQMRAPILDGNVRRLLCRSHGVDGIPGQAPVERRLWALATDLLPAQRLADYTQAVMDLGATVCRRARPDCAACPLESDCVARATDRIAELPTPRVRRRLPERAAAWLLLLDPDGRVLLQRRPAPGLWGGLWSLPEAPECGELRAGLALRLGRDPGPPQRLAPVRHLFSHYALTATPWQWRLPRPLLAVAEADRERWLDRGALATLGLPQPVRRLLADTLDGEPERSRK